MAAVHEDPNCRLCNSTLPVPTARQSDDTAVVQCSVCGDYEITPSAHLLLLHVMGEEKRYLLSGRARMSEIETGVRHRFDEVEIQAMKAGQFRDKTFSESALSVMRWLSVNRPGSVRRLVQEQDHPIGYCRDFNELKFIVFQLQEAGFVAVKLAGHALDLHLTGKGWQWLENQIKEGTGQQAFIAISYSDALAGPEAALKAGVLAAGYHPVLVKYREFSDGIADRIFAEIRRSRFVVADFTENRGGVYYEAGFALGLGLRVIGTCQDVHLQPGPDQLHFDIRHLNMISWKADKLDDLSESVAQRIRGMIRQGPVKPWS